MTTDALAPTPAPSRRRKANGAATVEATPGPRPGDPRTALNPATPSRTFRLPNGKTMTVATDRVRAEPAVTPQVSFVLGQNAIGLGLWGLLAPKGLNRFLGIDAAPQTTQALFGARELATGVALFRDPTKAGALWARVAGDAFDIAVLSRLNTADNAKRRNVRFALAVVLAVTALDVVAAMRMTNVKRSVA